MPFIPSTSPESGEPTMPDRAMAAMKPATMRARISLGNQHAR